MEGNATGELECLTDVDCPGAKVCYLDVPWTDEPALCACSSWSALTGDNCDELGGPGVLVASSCAVIALAALVTAKRAISDVMIIGRESKQGLLGNASNSTTLLTTLALVGQVCWQLNYLLEQTIPLRGRYLLILEGGWKVSYFKTWTSVAIVVVEALTLPAMLNLSVMWLEVSQRAKAMSPQMVQNVTRYRRACLVAGGTFFALMLSAAVVGKVELGPVLAMPFLFGISVLFAIGRTRMVSVLVGASSKPGSVAKTSADATERKRLLRIKRTVASIRSCAKNVIIAQFTILVAGLAYFMANSLPAGGWKAISPAGGWCIPAVVGIPLPVAMYASQLTLFKYCHENLQKRLKAKSKKVTAGNGNSGISSDSALTVDGTSSGGTLTN